MSVSYRQNELLSTPKYRLVSRVTHGNHIISLSTDHQYRFVVQYGGYIIRRRLVCDVYRVQKQNHCCCCFRVYGDVIHSSEDPGLSVTVILCPTANPHLNHAPCAVLCFLLCHCCSCSISPDPYVADLRLGAPSRRNRSQSREKCVFPGSLAVRISLVVRHHRTWTHSCGWTARSARWCLWRKERLRHCR